MANDKKEGINPLATAVAGAVIGAAAAAAAIALSDEKNRAKAEKVLKDLQKEGDKVLKEVSKKALEFKDLGEKALSSVASKKGQNSKNSKNGTSKKANGK